MSVKRNKGPCYYCGAAAINREHAPPEMFFQGFPCDSITVPSCETHNTEKGGNDQAIVSAFLLALKNGRNQWPLEPDIKKALEEGESSFQFTKRKAVSVALINNPPPQFADLPEVSHIAPSANIRSWVRNLTAALTYDAIGAFEPSIVWDKASAWSPDWVGSDTAAPLPYDNVRAVLIEAKERRGQLDSLGWINGWSAHPRPYPPLIYSFDLHTQPDLVVFRHSFYRRYLWYVCFDAPGYVELKLFERASRNYQKNS